MEDPERLEQMGLDALRKRDEQVRAMERRRIANKILLQVQALCGPPKPSRAARRLRRALVRIASEIEYEPWT